jgi:hypothetical protein
LRNFTLPLRLPPRLRLGWWRCMLIVGLSKVAQVGWNKTHRWDRHTWCQSIHWSLDCSRRHTPQNTKCFHHLSFASGLSTCFAHGSRKIRRDFTPSTINSAFTWLYCARPHNKHKHQNSQNDHSQKHQCSANHLRKSSMVYSVSLMWATGWSHPRPMHSAMISLYSRGHSLLTSKLARGTTTSPLGENLKSTSVERNVLWGRRAEILIMC